MAKKKDRGRSSGSIYSSQPQVRRRNSQPHGQSTNKSSKQYVSFSTRHSSDEDDEDEDGTAVHRKSSDIVESPQCHHDLKPQLNHTSPAPTSVVPHHYPPSTKSALKEGLSSSIPKFLQKSLSQVALVPPKISITNAVSKDLTRPTSVEHIYTDPGVTSTSEPQIPPSSNPISHFVSSTPPSRSLKTPDLEMTTTTGGLRRNQSSTSLATTSQDYTIPLTSASQGKLTRTQQKLLLQRASAQPLVHPLTSASYTTANYTPSPSLHQTFIMEGNNAPSDYFSPLPSTTQTMLTPGVAVNIPYDVKVAREFERISKELSNARRFGDPVTDALTRLQDRMNPSSFTSTSGTPKQGLTKKQSAFSMSWKRSPDKGDNRRGGNVIDDDVLGDDGERRSKVRDVMKKLWFDDVDVADVMGLDDDDGDEVSIRRSKR